MSRVQRLPKGYLQKLDYICIHFLCDFKVSVSSIDQPYDISCTSIIGQDHSLLCISVILELNSTLSLVSNYMSPSSTSPWFMINNKIF